MTQTRPWHASYPSSVAHDVNLTDSSINQIFDTACHTYAQQPAYSNFGRTITYAQLEDMVEHFARYFVHELKLKKGDRIAVMLPNVLQYPVVVFAALRAGLVVVNTNPMYTERELEHQLKDADVKTLVVLENFAHTVEKVLDVVPLEHIIVTGIGDLLSFPKSVLIPFVLKYIARKIPDFSLKHTAFKDILNKPIHKPLNPIAVTHDDLAFLQYTGGTTGLAKGAMLTHGNMVANVTQASMWLDGNQSITPGKEIIITALPLYHIFALTANCLTFMKYGSHNHLITDPRNIKSFIKIIKNTGFTGITGVNTLFNALLNHDDFKGVDFSKLHISLGGGMAVQKAVATRWKQTTGCTLIEAYGLTETSPAACINPMNLKEYNGSIGLPIPGTDAQICNEDGNVVAQGDVGELWIKGPQVMKGYWRQPEETAKTMNDGWLRTGDMVKMDEQGFVYLVDRKKDMVLVSGFNVYPNEVEDVIAMMPEVAEVGVVGVPDPHSGEVVKAVIVKKDPDLTAQQVKTYCKEQLTAYKVPKKIEFRDELPKTNVGKILRRKLRES